MSICIRFILISTVQNVPIVVLHCRSDHLEIQHATDPVTDISTIYNDYNVN